MVKQNFILVVEEFGDVGLDPVTDDTPNMQLSLIFGGKMLKTT